MLSDYVQYEVHTVKTGVHSEGQTDAGNIEEYGKVQKNTKE